MREWKETFVLLAHLFEPEFPGLKDLKEEVLKEEQFLPLKNESPPALPGEVTLLCKECGYYFPFKPRVVLLVDEDMEPDLTEKVVCPKCGAEESFILPENEKRRLQMQFMLLVHKKEKTPGEWEDGIVIAKELWANIKGKLQTFRRYRDILALYRRFFKADPRNPEVLSGYIHLLLKGRRMDEAREALERLGTVEPGCVDYVYLQAIYHRLQGEPEKALQFYHKAIEALARGAPFYRLYSRDSAEGIRAIFFEVRNYARDTGRPFTINEDVLCEKKKIGRNDPCPCGSGKKYKKCCLKKKEAEQEKKSAQTPRRNQGLSPL